MVRGFSFEWGGSRSSSGVDVTAEATYKKRMVGPFVSVGGSADAYGNAEQSGGGFAAPA